VKRFDVSGGRAFSRDRGQRRNKEATSLLEWAPDIGAPQPTAQENAPQALRGRKSGGELLGVDREEKLPLSRGSHPGEGFFPNSDQKLLISPIYKSLTPVMRRVIKVCTEFRRRGTRHPPRTTWGTCFF